MREYAVRENLYSVIFYTVATLKTMGKRLKIVFLLLTRMYLSTGFYFYASIVSQNISKMLSGSFLSSIGSYLFQLD